PPPHAMRRWVEATGVDGFRLDLAATLGRTDAGFSAEAPLLKAIESDPLLKECVLIAEPWDVGGGGYQLGSFPSRWSEWNDRFRDDVRGFWRGDTAGTAALATRLTGSSDIFGGRRPAAGINFIAAHDGFTLADLVAYERKHNRANGEGSRDGNDQNLSWNNGVEGQTDDPAISAARRRDIRALLATLLVARGTPMLTAGDEFGRTQDGNNNAYAQDNPITWLDWANGDAALVAFTARLAGLRAAHPSLSEDRFLTAAAVDETGVADIVWLKPDGEMRAEDWQRAGRVLGMALYTPRPAAAPGDRTVVWINGGLAAADVWLPSLPTGLEWRLEVDTADPRRAPSPALEPLSLPPRSVSVFAAERRSAAGRSVA
ncbi:MAG: hypothetical protein WD036_06635, partial [Bauldia sp.]